jgi:hypothetical protein
MARSAAFLFCWKPGKPGIPWAEAMPAEQVSATAITAMQAVVLNKPAGTANARRVVRALLPCPGFIGRDNHIQPAASPVSQLMVSAIAMSVAF